MWLGSENWRQRRISRPRHLRAVQCTGDYQRSRPPPHKAVWLLNRNIKLGGCQPWFQHVWQGHCVGQQDERQRSLWCDSHNHQQYADFQARSILVERRPKLLDSMIWAKLRWSMWDSLWTKLGLFNVKIPCELAKLGRVSYYDLGASYGGYRMIQPLTPANQCWIIIMT